MEAGPITPGDLLEIVDISAPAPSPDGRWVAYRLHRARPDGSGYDVVWHIGPTEPGGTASALLDPGEPVLECGFLEGIQDGPEPLVAWSPDSTRIALQAREEDRLQLVLLRRDGGERVVLAELSGPLRHLSFSRDGRRVAYATSPRMAMPYELALPASGSVLVPDEARHALGLKGYVHLARHQAVEPEPVAWPDLQHWSVPVNRPGSPEARKPPLRAASPLSVLEAAFGEVTSLAPSPDGHRLAFLRRDPDDPYGGYAVMVAGATDPAGARCLTGNIVRPQVTSPAAQGRGHPALWWGPDGETLLFLARDAAYRGTLQAVPAAGGPVRTLSRAEGSLSECRVSPGRTVAVCMEDTDTRPADLVRVDLRDGATRCLTDLHPRFRALRFGRTTILEATSRYGDRSWARLIHPPEFRPGRPLPLTVSPYAAGGFPRGAVGNEFPLHVFAARGYLVLDIERPRGYAADAEAGGEEAWTAWFKDTDGAFSVVEELVGRLVADGLADPDRMGITGLSNGADIASFAMQHSRLFRAAAVSALPHLDALTYGLGGLEMEAYWASAGLEGGPTGPNAARWRAYHPGLAGVPVAVLINVSETEYLMSLGGCLALRRSGQPAELHVHLGEDHQKMRPSLRLEIYRRNLDWFDYWLRGRRDPDPAKAPQYARWDRLRAGAATRWPSPD